jgi:hypothetical protein
MMMTSLSPLMFAAKKKAVAKKPAAKAPAAKQAPAKSAPAPKPIAEDNPAMLREDTQANREKATQFLFDIIPSDNEKFNELKEVVGDGVLDEFVEFFKDTGDYDLNSIQTMIRLAQSKSKADQQKAVTVLVSIAREMGHGISFDD